MGSTNKLRHGANTDDRRSAHAVGSFAVRTTGAVGRRLLDGLLPPRCAACGVEIESGQGLCATCWRGLTFIDAPLCIRCGLPFDFEAPATTQCAACLAKPPPFDQARAALVYDDGSRPLILGFKHGDRTDRAAILARLMVRLLPDLAPDLTAKDGLVMPVPLHRWRLWRRRYNQSALLALEVARHSDLTYCADSLVRNRATPSQAGQNAGERRRNVRGAFGIRSRTEARLANRPVLLVDDVMTTGATVRECARVLKRAGAASVSVAVIARAVMPSRVD